ncbi:hypothetical protein HDV00_010348 [Rhizophlyctis rosea]|nr:hypothetical protein HDV00_010348 [Rhizophlyctis rosea]
MATTQRLASLLPPLTSRALSPSLPNITLPATKSALGTAVGAALGWLSGILWAVPKKKPSYRVRRIRHNVQWAKWFRPAKSIRTCPICTSPVYANNLCYTCIGKLVKRQLPKLSEKEEKRIKDKKKQLGQIE